MGMELYQLEQLLAFDKYHTLSQTAEELLLSQPAPGRSRQRSESDLDVSLFDRPKIKLSSIRSLGSRLACIYL